MTISASTTQRSRQLLPHRGHDLGEVAGHRALVAAAELDLVAVAEHDAAEAVPLRLVEEAGPSGTSFTDLASIGATGGITGRSIGSFCLSGHRVPGEQRAVLLQQRRSARAGPAGARARPRSGRRRDRRACGDRVRQSSSTRPSPTSAGEQARAALAEDRAAPVQPRHRRSSRSSTTMTSAHRSSSARRSAGESGPATTTVRTGGRTNRLELRSSSRRRETTANVRPLVPARRPAGGPGAPGRELGVAVALVADRAGGHQHRRRPGRAAAGTPACRRGRQPAGGARPA